MIRAGTHKLARGLRKLLKKPDQEQTDMQWSKPSYRDLRFGFEITMYIYNR